MEKVRGALQPVDPISQAGLTSILTAHKAFEVLPAARSAAADVVVFMADRLTVERLRREVLAPHGLHRLRRALNLVRMSNGAPESSTAVPPPSLGWGPQYDETGRNRA